MTVDIDSKYVYGCIQALYLVNCVESAIMGQNYVLSVEDISDLLDNVCIITHRQAAAKEAEDRGMCESDASMTLAETVVGGVCLQTMS